MSAQENDGKSTGNPDEYMIDRDEITDGNREAANRESALVLGWSPEMFGLDVDDYGSLLVDAVRTYQDEWEMELVDGFVDPSTLRRMQISLYVEDDDAPDDEPLVIDMAPVDHITYAGQRVPCYGRVITAGEAGAMVLKRGNFYKRVRKPGKVDLVVVHWPVTRSERASYNALSRKGGPSTNFLIGDDGTIYQFKDPAYGTWHAGKCVDRPWTRRSRYGSVNGRSVGIDLQCEVGSGGRKGAKLNAKIQRRRRRAGKRERPVVEYVSINGWARRNFLGFFPEQVEALGHLLAALASCTAIPLVSPGYYKPNRMKLFKAKGPVPAGVWGHGELKRGKWDPAGLDLRAACEVAQGLSQA